MSKSIKVKLTTQALTTQTTEVTLRRHATVPAWYFGMAKCAVCRKTIEDGALVVAESAPMTLHFFCLRCWEMVGEGRKEPDNG